MGKKDKRRKRMKNFIQNKQRQEKAKQEQVLCPTEDKNTNNSNTNNENNTTASPFHTVVHNITTTCTSPDDSTITENTPLNTVTDTYESIKPIDDTIHNSSSQLLSRSSLPPLNIETSIGNNDTASLELLSVQQRQQQQNVSKVSNTTPHSSTFPPSSRGSLAPVDSMNSNIPNVNSIPELDLNDQEDNSELSRKSIKSTYLLTPVRKWISISIIYLFSMVIGFDLGKTWIHQSIISSKFQQFYNTSQLLTFLALGYWLQNHFRLNFSVRNNIAVVSIFEMLSFFTLDWTPCFPLLLLSRLVTGISVGLFLRGTLTFFENIGSIRYRIPSCICAGTLCAIFFNTVMCNWLFYGTICLIMISSIVVLPNTKNQIEVTSYVINRQNLFVVVGYIAIQFLLIFIDNSYKFILAFSIIIPLYVHIDNKTRNGKMMSLFSSLSSSSSSTSSLSLIATYNQDKLAILLRISVLLLATVDFYSLSTYLDILQRNYDRVYCLLLGVLFGSILSEHISYRAAFFTLILTVLNTITMKINDLNLFSKLLVVVVVGCFVIMCVNTKPLRASIPSNYTFEIIIIISGLIIADALTHIYPKKLIYNSLMEIKSKKHPYDEIIEIINHSNKSIEWIHNKAPMFALTIIKSCYEKSFMIVWILSGILSALIFLLTIIINHLE